MCEQVIIQKKEFAAGQTDTNSSPSSGFWDKRFAETGFGNENRALKSAIVEKPKGASNPTTTYLNYRTYANQPYIFTEQSEKAQQRQFLLLHTVIDLQVLKCRSKRHPSSWVSGATTEACWEHKRNWAIDGTSTLIPCNRQSKFAKTYPTRTQDEHYKWKAK